AVVGHRAVDVGAAAHEIAELAAEAIAHRADLAVAFGHVLQDRGRSLHAAHGEVVLEIVVEIERLFHVFGIRVVQFDSRLLAPEQVRHEAYESGLGKLLRVTPHGVVHAPDFHDGDDGARGGVLGEGDVRPHLTVPQADAELPGSHQFSFSSARALPAKIHSFSASGISRPFTALMVSRISMRPFSASNGTIPPMWWVMILRFGSSS